MNNARCSASLDRLSQSQLRRAARAAPTLDCITGTAVLEFGPAETLSPVGAYRRLFLVSVDRVTSHSPHTRAKSRGFRPRRATPAERRTVCWRKRDSNHRSRVTRPSFRCRLMSLMLGSPHAEKSARTRADTTTMRAPPAEPIVRIRRPPAERWYGAGGKEMALVAGK